MRTLLKHVYSICYKEKNGDTKTKHQVEWFYSKLSKYAELQILMQSGKIYSGSVMPAKKYFLDLIIKLNYGAARPALSE